MVKYYGRLNTNNGYLIIFDLYQGQNPHGNADYEKLFGKCSSPMIEEANLISHRTGRSLIYILSGHGEKILWVSSIGH